MAYSPVPMYFRVSSLQIMEGQCVHIISISSYIDVKQGRAGYTL